MRLGLECREFRLGVVSMDRTILESLPFGARRSVIVGAVRAVQLQKVSTRIHRPGQVLHVGSPGAYSLHRPSQVRYVDP